MLNPVKELAEIAHANNIEIIVDAISSYAGIAIDIERDGFDYIVSTSNKNIQGMAGISFVITKKVRLEKTKSYKRNNLYFNLYDQYISFKNTGQMQFTPAVQIIYALNQALDEYFKETPAGRFERYAKSWKILTSGLIEMGFKLFLPLDQHAGLITAVHEPTDGNYRFDSLHDYLFEKGYTIYPGKVADINMFRIANIGAIDQADILSFLTELESYLNENKLNLLRSE